MNLLHRHLHVLREVEIVGEIECFFFFHRLNHVDEWKILWVNLHLGVVVEWYEHQLLHSVNGPLQKLTDDGRLLNENQMGDFGKLNVTKYTIDSLLERCRILNLCILLVDIFIVNVAQAI